jgi:hypothetical protein
MNFLKKIFHFEDKIGVPLEMGEVERIKTSKLVIDEVVKTIDSQLDTVVDLDSFHLEPDKTFYKKSLDQRKEIIFKRIGIANEIKIDSSHLINRAGEFMAMPGVVIDTNTKKVEWTKNNSGLTINISDKYSKDARIESAVLVHEITHFYLHKTRFKDKSSYFAPIDEELMCEITTFSLGLGKIFLNGLFRTEYTKTGIISLQPHFPWYMLLYIYERVNFVKGIPQNISENNLSSDIKERLARMSNYRDLIK